MPPRSPLATAAAITAVIVGASVALAAGSPTTAPVGDAAPTNPAAAPATPTPAARPAPATLATGSAGLPIEGDWLKRTPAPRASAPPTVPAQVATAQPTPTAAPPATRTHWDTVGAAAMQRVAMDWASLGWDVDFQAGRSGRLGLAVRDRRVIEVYVRDGHTEAQVAATLAHELTHVLDYERLTDADRQRWLAARGLPGVAWWPPCSCDDRAYGAGDLAEAAAVLASGPAHWTGTYPAPTADQLAVAAELLGWRG